MTLIAAELDWQTGVSMVRRAMNFLAGMSCFLLATQTVLLGNDARLEQPPVLAFSSTVETDSFRPGVKIFTDRTYTCPAVPDALIGMAFIRTVINGYHVVCQHPGVVYALTPAANRKMAATQEDYLVEQGFTEVAGSEFQLFGTNAIDKVKVFRKSLAVGDQLVVAKWAVLLAPRGIEITQWKPRPWSENDGELLHNGIQLPRLWPPRNMAQQGDGPLPVPYLDYPPGELPIDMGRQLFVDDFLIDSTTLQRTWHKARKYDGNPVMEPDTDLELGKQSGHAPMAAPFSGGVWYDPTDQIYKMWYCAGWFDGTAYAVSRDGISWSRPELDVEPGTNRVIPRRGRRDSAALILDPFATQQEPRFKMLVWGRPQAGELFTSSDGIHWSEPVSTGPMGDRSTIFFNPFRKKWVYSIRSSWRGRTRNYSEHDDLLSGASVANQVQWTRADNLDLPDSHGFYAFPDRVKKPISPELYNLDAVAYESLMLGAFAIYQGPSNSDCEEEGVPKLTEIHLGFSRDGFHWQRPEDRTPFIAASRKEGTWDRGYLHSNAAVCLVVGDELWFHYTGFAGDPARKRLDISANGMYANASTGIAKLRRDGFASMDAGTNGGTLTTKPVRFRGKRLFVNVDCPDGSLRVEVLDENSRPLEKFSAARCSALTVDSTLSEVTWKGVNDLSSLTGTPVRFRFHLNNGRLYSFWVSPNASGASNGYVAGGGPAFDGAIDIVGKDD
ncbi:hypothetical protein [Aporhodopirellula aestuarii]|uniref:Glycosyl hydrolase family 32 n=1 Tax=Aporhodopirellula aestuarii TaxID=2950107 RepID=A0ABT0UBB4_9BACT|nr:hypothetical protein [Aporhodopirellula aestuarii]MCM2374161.1 hypothetical protein [Aporhodopirellula aestuarii]